MIHRVEQFLTPAQCSLLIELHNRYSPVIGYSYRGRNTSLNCGNAIQYLDEHKLIAHGDALKILDYHVNSHIRSIADHTFVNYSEIVCWPEGSSQQEHLDYDYHSWTSIVYLNDDYQGGKTRVESEWIQPCAGSIITFEGSKLEHEVEPVVQGTRYTLAVWYKTFMP